MGRQIIISLFSLLFCSCYDSFGELDLDDDLSSSINANTTIAQIHTIYDAGVREINSEIIIAGRVTANDEHGNFFKSFIIEEDGYAIEVLDGLYDSFVSYPIGCKVFVRLDGLGIDRYLGVLRTGLVAGSTSSYTLDYMSAKSVVDLYVDVASDLTIEEPTPRTTTIEELDEANAGEFIKIDSLQLFTEDGVEREWVDYALFRDRNLDTIWCYTSTYANFASSKIPQGIVSLQGILEYGSTDSETNQFILKLRGEADCIY